MDRGRHISVFPYPDGLRVVGESCHVDDLGGVVHHGVDPGDLEEKKNTEIFQYDLILCERVILNDEERQGKLIYEFVTTLTTIFYDMT